MLSDPVTSHQSLLAGESNSIFTDSTGYFYLTGCFNGTASFGPDTIVSETLRDFFLARFSPDGDCLGAISFANGNGMSVNRFNPDVSRESYISSDSLFVIKQCPEII